MKQIRLKNSIIKVDECYDCPLLEPEYGFCSIVISIDPPTSGIHINCPLEDYDENND